jgi:hypothetical protein
MSAGIGSKGKRRREKVEAKAERRESKGSRRIVASP